MNPNHPANNVEPKGDYLKDKNIWLGITGSVSCVESVGLIRELLRYGAKVTVVANRSALELIGEKALEFACGKPIIKEHTTAEMDKDVEHNKKEIRRLHHQIDELKQELEQSKPLIRGGLVGIVVVLCILIIIIVYLQNSLSQVQQQLALLNNKL